MRQKGIKNGLSTTSLQIAILAFAFIIVMVVMTVAGTKNFGYLFWATECVALSGLILYTLFLTLMGEKHMEGLEKCTALYFNCLCNIEDAEDKKDEEREFESFADDDIKGLKVKRK
jgi:hypothetical protein